jgi:cytochrome c peroxidase
MKLKLSLIGITCALFALTSCEPKWEFVYYTPDQKAKLTGLNLPENGLDYSVKLPVHLTNAGLFSREIDGDKARLGRVIFYDKKLSSNGEVSCASCHHQDHAFADVTALSKGVDSRESARNSIALSSVVNFSAYYGTDINGPSAIRFFWDNRAETIEQQSRLAFTNPDEMGMHMKDIVSAIKAQEFYEPLFQKAYNPDPSDDVTKPVIDETKIFECMSHFINSMGSYRSKFDVAADALYSNGNSFFGAELIGPATSLKDFTSDEMAGKNLYSTNCSSCHSMNMGRPSLNYANNGLDLVYKDQGVGGAPGVNNPALNFQFKVPTLRNIEWSAPYMHDGRFATLEEVIDHYSNGIKSNSALHANLRNGSTPKQMNFTAKEKEQLIAFLKTTSDSELKADERFSNPFQ